MCSPPWGNEEAAVKLTEHDTANGRRVYLTVRERRCEICKETITEGAYVTKGVAGNSWAPVCMACRPFSIENKTAPEPLQPGPAQAAEPDMAAMWAIIEIMGRQKIAGKISEQTLADKVFLRVDVPAVGDEPAFSQLLSGAAIYRVTPVTESIALAAARQIKKDPIIVYGIKARVEQFRLVEEKFDPEEYDTDGPWPPPGCEETHDG